MPAIRDALGNADLETWTRVRNEVVPSQPSTVEDARRELRRDPDRRYLLGELDGKVVGCAFVARSETMAGIAAVFPRVVPSGRRRGVGTALLRECSRYARSLGCTGLRSHVDADDEAGLAFAARYGFVEIDRQLELVRPLSGDESAPEPPPGVVLAELTQEHLSQVRALAREAAEDMPVPGAIGESVLADFVDDLMRAEAALVALVDGEVVGFAGLIRAGARPEALESTLTAVRQSYRGRGIAVCLKRSLAAWAAAAGYRELVTWTQQGNAAMQAVNERVGYRRGHVTITMQGPLLP